MHTPGVNPLMSHTKDREITSSPYPPGRLHARHLK